MLLQMTIGKGAKKRCAKLNFHLFREKCDGSYLNIELMGANGFSWEASVIAIFKWPPSKMPFAVIFFRQTFGK
jgi:hypothetical protein